MAASATALLLTSCDRTKPYTIEVPPAEAHFVGKVNQIYTVQDNANTQFKLSVGTTNVTNADRTITYKVKPSTNLAPGTGYTIATGNTTGTVTIKAGQAVADIIIKAPFCLSWVTYVNIIMNPCKKLFNIVITNCIKKFS